jgi:two-component system NarL family sensor kinase
MEMEVHQLSARLLGVQEEERRRLARDLHDSLGQKLTRVKFLIEAALGQPWPDERRSGMARLRALVSTIQDAVEEVRRISTELRPSILDDLGLLPTMAWHLREFERAHPGLVVEQRLDATDSEVPDGLRTPIYRVLQEATNNVAKHSGTSRMVVRLGRDHGRLCLSVQDDGVGFDPEAPPVRAAGNRGVGMGSMRERTELTGGTFSVRSSPGIGTTVRAQWPLNQPPPDEPVNG